MKRDKPFYPHSCAHTFIDVALQQEGIASPPRPLSKPRQKRLLFTRAKKIKKSMQTRIDDIVNRAITQALTNTNATTVTQRLDDIHKGVTVSTEKLDDLQNEMKKVKKRKHHQAFKTTTNNEDESAKDRKTLDTDEN
ncbi:hypothetical protein ACHAPE_002507 [Trichoderma viride]